MKRLNGRRLENERQQREESVLNQGKFLLIPFKLGG
jgi:hypothetical protein